MGRSWVGAGVKEVTWRGEVSGTLCISYSQTFECSANATKEPQPWEAFPPSPQTIPFTLSGEQPSWRNVRQHVSLAFRGSLPHPFEMQCKPINSTLLLVAACMVCVSSIRKTVNPAHLFTLTSKGSPHAHWSAGNYWHGLLDHEKMEAYGRIHTWTDCFFS